MSKEKKVSIFNKGKREFSLEGEVLTAGGTLKVSKELAAKLMKMYPLEIVKPLGEVSSGDTSKLEAELKSAMQLNADLTVKVEELEADLEVALELASDAKDGDKDPAKDK